MPRIDDLLLKSVFYVYMSKEDASQGYPDSATGFLFSIPAINDENLFFIYGVTNKHVIMQKGMDTPTLRINNLIGGFDVIETKLDDWKFHSLGSDLAICSIEISNDYDCSFLNPEFLLTNEFMEKYNVGVGDDVFMVGNFQSRSGRTKNIPTVRFGNIAQMPVEPMKNPHTLLEEESFIVEMRSACGYSGSPVILSIPWILSRKIRREQEEDNVPKWHEPEPDYYKLLGLDWGHLRIKERLVDKDGNSLPEEESVWINSAMAGVVPSWKLTEMLYDEMEIENRKKEEDAFIKEREKLKNTKE